MAADKSIRAGFRRHLAEFDHVFAEVLQHDEEARPILLMFEAAVYFDGWQRVWLEGRGLGYRPHEEPEPQQVVDHPRAAA